MKLQLIAGLLIASLGFAQNGQVVTSPNKGSVTATAIQSALGPQSGCSTTGTLYSPKTGTCISASGSAPVQSVAGKTGVVNLVNTDISGFSTVANTGSYTDLLNTPAPAQAAAYSPNQVVSGCGVEYVSGLSYSIGACSYSIASTKYSSALTTKTLATADPTNPRIDVIGVDVTGVVFVLTGTPSITPQQPTVDTATQLQLTFVYVPAAATAPLNVVATMLYDEGTEWTPTSTANVNTVSTSNPYHLTKDIEATTAVLGNNFKLTIPSGTFDPSTRNNLVFYIRSKGAWPTGNSGSNAARYLSFWFTNGTAQQGQQVVVKDGNFGFSSTSTTVYQQISIPLSLFGANGLSVTQLVGQVSGNSGTSSIGFYIDEVTLQGGTGSITLPSTLLNYRGTWNATKSYNQNDLVTSSAGIGYIALVANTNVAVSIVTTWQQLAPATQPYDLPFSLYGQPAANTVYPWVTIARPITFPANFSGAVGTVATNPTASATFTVSKNGTSIGTIVISTSGTYTFTTTGGAAINCIAGDRLTMTSPTVQDTTLAGVSVTVTGTR